MDFLLTALALKWASSWLILLLIGLVTGPTPVQGAVIALLVAALSLAGDRVLPFRVQGPLRWAIDSALAAATIYVGQFVWPGEPIALRMALLAGATVGSVEIPIHFYLAARFGLHERGGVR